MRQKMRQAFDELWIIDLEGDQHGARKTENVFAIQTPVAVAIGVRYGGLHPGLFSSAPYGRGTCGAASAVVVEVASAILPGRPCPKTRSSR